MAQIRKFWEWRNYGSRTWHRDGWKSYVVASRLIKEVWDGDKRKSRKVLKKQDWRKK